MFAEACAATAGLHTDEAHIGVGQELVKRANGVGAAADAGDDDIWVVADLLGELASGLDGDDAVEIANHGGIGMGAERRAKDVERGADVGDPVAHGLVDGVLEGGGTGGDAAHVGAEQAHADDIELLAAHVFLAHVDDAFQPKERAHGGGGNAVLARAGLCNDALLAA